MAAQAAKSKRGAGGRRRRQPPVRRAPEGKILRIGIIHGGRIVEEQLIPMGDSVTVGEHPRSTVVLSSAGLPSKKFDLFAASKGRKYNLNFTDKMHGKVAVDGEIRTLASLASKGPATKRGAYFTLGLNENTRGKVYVGDYTVLFQFVTPPPQPARRRRGDFRPFHWGAVDWLFLGFLVASAAVHTAIVVWIESQPPPKEMRLEDIPDRFVRIMMADDEPEPVEVEEEGEETGESEDAEEVAKEEAPEEAAGGEEEEAAPVESVEDRRARIEEEVAQTGLLALIGTAGASSSGDAVADLLSDTSSLSGDVGSALANSSGMAIGRRDSDGSGLRGGGGGDGAAGIGDIGGAGGGKGGSVAKKKTELKGSVKTGSADISSSPEDVMSVKKTMRRYNGRIKACYERQLKSNPDLKGKVTVSFEISTSGSVSAAAIEENTTRNKDLGKCIVREIGRITFKPPPEDDIEVAGYPFILSAQ